MCRWISPDSIEYLEPKSINGLNLYCYCYNNPISCYDPSGHSSLLIGLLIFTGAMTLGGAIYGGVSAGMAGGDVGDVFVGVGKGAWRDMRNIKWNPFNADVNKVMESNHISFYRGAPVFQVNDMGGSMSLGIIFFDKSQKVEVLMHERGHNTQLMSMGLVNYLIQIAIPSPWKNGDETPCELSASILGDSKLADKYSYKQKRQAYYYLRACFPIINIYNIIQYIFY